LFWVDIMFYDEIKDGSLHLLRSLFQKKQETS
jgi:hypothetical protein